MYCYRLYWLSFLLFGVICFASLSKRVAAEYLWRSQATTSTEKYVRTNPTSMDGDDCIMGNCTRIENCQSRDLIARNATGSCHNRRDGDWVCCVRNSSLNTFGSIADRAKKYFSAEDTENNAEMNRYSYDNGITESGLIREILKERMKTPHLSSLLVDDESDISHDMNSCSIGTCMRREMCVTPRDTISVQPSIECSLKEPKGAWVCCIQFVPTAVAEVNQKDSHFKSTKKPSAPVTSHIVTDVYHPHEDRNIIMQSSTPKNYILKEEGNSNPSKLVYRPYYDTDYHLETSEETYLEPEMRYHNSRPVAFPDYEEDVYNDWEADYYEGVPSRRTPAATKRPVYSGADCLKGNCVRRKDCSGWNSNLLPATGNCAAKSGDWVCCDFKNGNAYTTASTTTKRNTIRSMRGSTAKPKVRTFTQSSTARPKVRTTYTVTSTRPSFSENKWGKSTPTTVFTATKRYALKDGCPVGKCVERMNCQSPDSTTLPATGTCAKRYGDFICCHEKGKSPKVNVSTRTTTTTRPNIRNHSQKPTIRYTPEDINSYTVAEPNRNSFGECGLRQRVIRGRTGRGNMYRMEPDTEILASYADSPLINNMVRNNKVVGGKEATPYSWPWMVALFKESSGIKTFLCAGSLINHRYIISAAHVFSLKDVRNPSSFIAMLGTHTGSESIGESRIKSISLHPEYQRRYYYNDIAILELEEPVSYSPYILPICLPANDEYCEDSELVGKNVTVTGWGDDAFGGKSSDVLKEATFPIVSRRKCNAAYVKVASSKFPRGISDAMLCAGAPGGGKDACQGDSGGPLAIKQGQNWVQVGVVSFGYNCGDPQYPGVYTKVSSCVDWIKQNSNG